MNSRVQRALGLLNVSVFVYLMFVGGLLILTRWYSLAELLPWNLLLKELVEKFLRQLQVVPGFLGLMVLPGSLFMLWRLRELVRNEI